MPIAVPTTRSSMIAANAPAGAMRSRKRQSLSCWFQPAVVLRLRAPARSSTVNARMLGSNDLVYTIRSAQKGADVKPAPYGETLERQPEPEAKLPRARQCPVRIGRQDPPEVGAVDA